MKLWSAWLPDVLPHVLGCPNIVAESEIRRAAQDFFQRTRAYQIYVTSLVVAGQSFVEPVPTDSGLNMIRVENASYDGERLAPINKASLDADQNLKDWATRTGTPRNRLQLTPGVIRLYPIPEVNAVTGVLSRLSVAPSNDSTGISDEMYYQYLDEIKVGALSRLMIYPEARWKNTELALFYEGKFNSAIDTVHHQVARAFSNGRIAARPKWC